MKAALALAWLALALPLSAAPLELLVPAYFSPGPRWQALDEAAARGPLTAIMNPNNGPGSARDTGYVAAIDALHRAGGKVIGYVYSSYGKRPLAQIEADVDHYLARYAVDGFFVDEMTNDGDAAHLETYAALYRYIKGKGSRLTVIGNPGTNTVEEYLLRPTADALVIFENGRGYGAFTPAPWVAKHPAHQFVHLVLNIAGEETMAQDLDLARRRNAGAVYITDGKGSNPWDRLPGYWRAEVDRVGASGSSIR